MKVAVRCVLLAAALSGVTAAAGPMPALAYSTINELRAEAPRCRANPDYGFIGRVAGTTGAAPPRNVSLVGCFPSLRECQSWVARGSGRVNGRLIRADCSAR